MEPYRYVYDYACHEDERSLCWMELRVLLNAQPEKHYVRSKRAIDPSRSPFVHGRLTIERRSESLEKLAKQAAELELNGDTFKLRYVKTDLRTDYEECRRIERLVGAQIRGTADMKHPQRLYGIACIDGEWLLGAYEESQSIWLQHNKKPRQYSTALGTRTARAIANIAVPEPAGVRAVDPCCGIGTVLLAAQSMGIAMDGFDLNPLAAIGARENLAHFALPGTVTVADMRTLKVRYDALVLDLPYNLCSVLASDERIEMLVSARRLASRCVFVATEDIVSELGTSGFSVIESCIVRKGRFSRYVWLVE
ncbi:RNA methyltransferase [Saccharibacillus sacchari]|uniref:RNA methyltransferase n=1 Tax=Saccharibacillus sacchari TaxID=456493 RepID=A0ACC6PJR9_9BACL